MSTLADNLIQKPGLSQETRLGFLILGLLNAILTLAYPAALASLLYVSETSAVLRFLAMFFIFMAAVSCFTLLGLRRYLAVVCDFDGASGALAVHAGVSAASGIAILIGWGVLSLGSMDSDLSWALGLTVLGFFLVVGIAIGVLELLIGRALGKTSADGYGLIGPIRLSFFIAGIANLVSILIGFTIIIGMAAYAVVAGLLALLFWAVWREHASGLPEDFRFGQGWIAAVICIAILSLAVPAAAALYQLQVFMNS